MRTVSAKSAFVMALVFAFLVTMLLGCPPQPEIWAKLTLSEPPILGKPVEVTLTFGIQKDYSHDAKNATARISLPEGFELVSGNLEWQGDVLQNQTYAIEATIKSVKTGYWELAGRIQYSPPGSDDILGGADFIYVAVSEDKAEIS